VASIRPACSLVIPCHNEEHNVAPLYAAIAEVIGQSTEYELVFVDDGSTDGTFERLKELRRRDLRVKYLRLATNYGHQKALLAGLRHAQGETALTLDADLQHPPQHIPDFRRVLESSGADVVVGQRTVPQPGLVKHLASKLFYRLFGWLTGYPLVPDASDFRLYSRAALEAVCRIEEREPFLRGLVASLRLKTAVVEYRPKPRAHDRPSYTFRRSASLGVRALLRFSGVPVKLGAVIGVAGLVLSLAQACHYLYLRLFTDALVPGQADLMVLLGIVSSALILMLALVLRLLHQVHELVSRQPLFLVAERELEGPEQTAEHDTGGAVPP